MATTKKIITSIHKGVSPIQEIFRGRSGTKLPIKCIYFRKSTGDFSADFGADFARDKAGIFNNDFSSDFIKAIGGGVRIYDNATFTLIGATLHFAVGGGTQTAVITSNITHGDGVTEGIGYTGQTTITRPVNTTGVEQQGYNVITQEQSGLTEYVRWTQDADSIVAYGDVELLTFSYADIDVFGNAVTPSLSYRQKIYWASGQESYRTSGATIMFSGQYVGVDGSVSAETVAEERVRTKITTATLSITMGGGKSLTTTRDVYQSACSVTSVSVYASKISGILSTGADVIIRAEGTLESSVTIDITDVATWTKGGTATTTFGTDAYARKIITFAINEDRTAKNATITATYKGNSSSKTLTQNARSSICGDLILNWSSAISGQQYYLNYNGARMLNTYAVGMARNGSVTIYGDSLDIWEGLEQWTAIKDFGLYSSQSATSLVAMFSLTQTQVNNLKMELTLT